MASSTVAAVVLVLLCPFMLVAVILIKRQRRKRRRGEVKKTKKHGPVRTGKDLIARPSSLMIVSKNGDIIPTDGDPVRAQLSARAKGDKLWMAYRRCAAFDHLYLGNELMCLPDDQIQDVFVVLGLKRPPCALLAPLRTVGARFKATELSIASDDAQLDDVVDFLFAAIPDVLVERSIDCLALHTAKKEAVKQKKREERDKLKEETRLHAELAVSAPDAGIVAVSAPDAGRVADGGERQYEYSEVLGEDESQDESAYGCVIITATRKEPMYMSTPVVFDGAEGDYDDDEDDDDLLYEGLYEALYAMIEECRPAEDGYRGLLPDTSDRSVGEVDPLYWDLDHLSDDHIYDDISMLQRDRMRRNEDLFRGTPWDLTGDTYANGDQHANRGGDCGSGLYGNGHHLEDDLEPPSSSTVDVRGRRSSIDALRLLFDDQREGDAYARMQTTKHGDDYGLHDTEGDYGLNGTYQLGADMKLRMRLGDDVDINLDDQYSVIKSGDGDIYPMAQPDADEDYGLHGTYQLGTDMKLRMPLGDDVDINLDDEIKHGSDVYPMAQPGNMPATTTTTTINTATPTTTTVTPTPGALSDCSEHMLVVEHRDAVSIFERPDTEYVEVPAYATRRLPFGDRPELGEAGRRPGDQYDQEDPVDYDLALEALLGLACAPDDEGLEPADGDFVRRRSDSYDRSLCPSDADEEPAHGDGDLIRRRSDSYDRSLCPSDADEEPVHGDGDLRSDSYDRSLCPSDEESFQGVNDQFPIASQTGAQLAFPDLMDLAADAGAAHVDSMEMEADAGAVYLDSMDLVNPVYLESIDLVKADAGEVYLDATDLQADLDPADYLSCVDDGENERYAVARPLVGPGTARESLESMHGAVFVSEAEDASSPALSPVAGVGAVPPVTPPTPVYQGEESEKQLAKRRLSAESAESAESTYAEPSSYTCVEEREPIYEYAAVNGALDLSAVPLRAAPDGADSAAPTGNRRRMTLWEVSTEDAVREEPDKDADEVLYEFATMRRGKPSAATPTMPAFPEQGVGMHHEVHQGTVHQVTAETARTKAGRDAPAPISSKTAPKQKGRRWSKDLKRSKKSVIAAHVTLAHVSAVPLFIFEPQGGSPPPDDRTPPDLAEKGRK